MAPEGGARVRYTYIILVHVSTKQRTEEGRIIRQCLEKDNFVMLCRVRFPASCQILYIVHTQTAVAAALAAVAAVGPAAVAVAVAVVGGQTDS